MIEVILWLLTQVLKWCLWILGGLIVILYSGAGVKEPTEE